MSKRTDKKKRRRQEAAREEAIRGAEQMHRANLERYGLQAPGAYVGEALRPPVFVEPHESPAVLEQRRTGERMAAEAQERTGAIARGEWATTPWSPGGAGMRAFELCAGVGLLTGAARVRSTHRNRLAGTDEIEGVVCVPAELVLDFTSAKVDRLVLDDGPHGVRLERDPQGNYGGIIAGVDVAFTRDTLERLAVVVIDLLQHDRKVPVAERGPEQRPVSLGSAAAFAAAMAGGGGTAQSLYEAVREHIEERGRELRTPILSDEREPVIADEEAMDRARADFLARAGAAAAQDLEAGLLGGRRCYACSGSGRVELTGRTIACLGCGGTGTVRAVTP